MRVFAYRNLNQKCWSLKSRESGYRYDLVLGHVLSVVLKNCTFSVGEKGRERVIYEQRKNVHAGIVGNIVAINSFIDSYRALDDRLREFVPGSVLVTDLGDDCEVTYNPFKRGSFYFKSTDEVIKEASRVCLLPTMRAYVG